MRSLALVSEKQLFQHSDCYNSQVVRTINKSCTKIKNDVAFLAFGAS